MQQLLSLMISIVMFFLSLFGFNPGTTAPETPADDTTFQPVYLSDTTVAYGENDDQNLDLYLPAGKTAASLVVLIHGGAWVTGTKETYLSEALRLQAMGYAVANINYRYLGKGVLPSDELDDITAAMAAAKTVCAQKGVTLQSAALMGVSSGGHLALLYAYTKQADAPVPVKTVISSSAPTDLTDPAFLQGAAGELAASVIGMSPQTLIALAQSPFGQLFMTPLANISPAKKVTTSSVPTLMAHGEKDTIVPYSNAVLLDTALTENGVPHDFVSFPNSSHALLQDPDCTLRFRSLTNQYLARYL